MDGIMAGLLAIVITVVVLYPETFMSGFPILGSEITQPLSILLPVIILACVVYAFTRHYELRLNAADIAVLAFAVFFIARNAATDKSMIAIKFALLAVGLFFLTTMLAERLRLARIIMWIFVGLTCVVSVYGVLEFALQKNIIYKPYISQFVPDPVEGLHRAGSSLAHPVVFGAFIIQMLPFCVLAFKVGRNRKQQALGLAASIMAVLALFFTFTKGSWVIALMAAGGLIAYVLFKRRKRGIYVTLLLLALAGVILGIFWQEVRSELKDRADVSIGVRLISWDTSIKRVSESPVFGVGLKQGGEELFGQLNDEEKERVYEATSENPPVDNYYLVILLEEGIAGLILWLLALFLIIREGVVMVGQDTSGRPFAIAALAGIIGISLNAITFDALMIWSNYVIFWVTAGLLHGLWKEKYQTGPPMIPW